MQGAFQARCAIGDAGIAFVPEDNELVFTGKRER
jgi:hypothetical protein